MKNPFDICVHFCNGVKIRISKPNFKPWPKWFVPIMIISKHKLTLPETVATLFHFLKILSLFSFPFFLFWFFGFFFLLYFKSWCSKNLRALHGKNAFLLVSKVQTASVSEGQFCEFLDSFSPLPPFAIFPELNMLIAFLLYWESVNFCVCNQYAMELCVS